MNPTFVIECAGRRPAQFYVGFLFIFWLLWTAVTAWVTVSAVLEFSFFWLLWLPLSYAIVFSIPYILIQSRKPRTLEVTPEALVIHETGIPFARVIEIPRTQAIQLHFGNYKDDGEVEAVATLNILSGNSRWTKRIMIASLSHPMEKRQIFRDLQTFLLKNGFPIDVQDEYQHHESNKRP